MESTTENELETSNSSISEGQQQPRPNDGIAEQDKRSVSDESLYHVTDILKPIAQHDPGTTTSRPISTEGSS
jgi:hypothetical protein